MNQGNAYRVLLARAIETEDRDGSLLSEPLRRQLAREAGPPPAAAPAPALDREQQDWLARRARLLLDALRPAHPALARTLDLPQHRAWLAVALPLAALFGGAAFHDLGSRGAINILAFPLLGMLLWNLAVYAALLLRQLRPTGAAPQALTFGLRRLAARWLDPATALLPRGGDGQGILARASLRFAADWTTAGAALLTARGARVLHLAAAMLATGAVAGMYVRGLAFEYRAGWESTFLDADAVARLVGTLLAPAAALSGIDLPQPGQWQELRLSPQQPGENAARWIHLHAITAGLFIVLPRLGLALGAWLRERRCHADFPLPPRNERYFARLLAQPGSASGKLRLLSYSYRLPGHARERLQNLLERSFGSGLEISGPQLIEYGDEDAFIASCAGDEAPRADALVLVFNLAATPERELHGRLCDGLAQGVAAGRLARRLIVLVDESTYRSRLAAESGAGQRLAQRRAAWHEALAGHDLVSVDLGAAADGADDGLEALRTRAQAAA